MNNNFTRNDILRRGDYRSIRKQFNILPGMIYYAGEITDQLENNLIFYIIFTNSLFYKTFS